MNREVRICTIMFAVAAWAMAGAAEGDCLRNDCSNDVAIDPQFGDEILAWDPNPNWSARWCPATATECVSDEERRCYQIAWDETREVLGEACESASREANGNWIYRPAPTRFALYAVDQDHFPRVGATYRYSVRTCEGERCSEWSTEPEEAREEYVEILGVDYACFDALRQRCEAECYPGSPRRFPHIPRCRRSG